MKKKLALLALITLTQTHPLTIDRVILSSDANAEYLEFWPIVAKMWQEIIGIKPTLALIASSDTPIDESQGDIIRFEPIDGIPTSLQAQVIRLLLPAYFETDVCLIADIDMLPLNKEYFINPVQQYPENCFIVYRDNAYHSHEHKFPMCYIAARGSTFKELFAVDNITNIPTIIKNWHALHLGWCTDELMLYQYLHNWNDYNTRCIRLGHTVERRIDRNYWIYDSLLLEQQYYIDAHCPRPYSQHKDSIDRIVSRIKTNIKKRCLENADYGTHMTALITAVIHTDGPILEMGAGDFSTPLLHAICSKNQRFLLTTDTDKKWLNNFIDLKNTWHDFQYVAVYEDDWSVNPKPSLWDTIGNDTHWSVVLIDHRPGERRIEDICRLRNNTDIFVVHDTQEPSYQYESILNTFKYKYVYERYSTQTTLVSDTINIAQLFEK